MGIRVLCDGCFDGLHPGHLAHLRAAAKLGDELLVALTADEHVNKGQGRPVFPWLQRAAMLRALRCVDTVYMVDSGKQAIEYLKPDIYVKGAEYRGRLPEQELVESYGGRVVFLDTSPVYSSTDLLTGKYLEDRVRAARAG